MGNHEKQGKLSTYTTALLCSEEEEHEKRREKKREREKEVAIAGRKQQGVAETGRRGW
jgi:hypothetical protein